MKPIRVTHLTPELIARFTAWYEANDGYWGGALHVVMDDENWASYHDVDDSVTGEERELALILETLSPSQRRRLASKAQKPWWDRWRQEQVVNNRTRIGPPMQNGMYVTEKGMP